MIDHALLNLRLCPFYALKRCVLLLAGSDWTELSFTPLATRLFSAIIWDCPEEFVARQGLIRHPHIKDAGAGMSVNNRQIQYRIEVNHTHSGGCAHLPDLQIN